MNIHSTLNSSKTLQLVLLLVSLWFFNLAICSSFYEGNELTFNRMFYYGQINPISSFTYIVPLSYRLKKEEVKKREMIRDRRITKLVLGYKNETSQTHQNNFNEFVYNRYYSSFLKDDKLSYSDYTSVLYNPDHYIDFRSNRKPTKSELLRLERYKRNLKICQNVRTKLLEDGLHTSDCDKELHTVENIGSVIKEEILSVLKRTVVKLKRTLLDNTHVEFSKNQIHYKSKISLDDYDKVELKKLCHIGLNPICKWIDKPHYKLKFYYSSKHEALLLANQSNDNTSKGTNWEKTNKSILLKVSDVPVTVYFLVSINRKETILDHGDYLLYTSLKIYIEPQLSSFESLLSPGYLVDSYSVDISLSVYERVGQMFSRVFSSVPGALTAILSLLNMFFLLNLIIKGNFSGLKKILKKQTQHD